MKNTTSSTSQKYQRRSFPGFLSGKKKRSSELNVNKIASTNTTTTREKANTILKEKDVPLSKKRELRKNIAKDKIYRSIGKRDPSKRKSLDTPVFVREDSVKKTKRK